MEKKEINYPQEKDIEKPHHANGSDPEKVLETD